MLAEHWFEIVQVIVGQAGGFGFEKHNGRRVAVLRIPAKEMA